MPLCSLDFLDFLDFEKCIIKIPLTLKLASKPSNSNLETSFGFFSTTGAEEPKTGFLKACLRKAFRKPVFKIRSYEKAPSVAHKVLAIGAFKKFMKRSD